MMNSSGGLSSTADPSGNSTDVPGVQGPIEVFVVQWIICIFGLVGNFLVLYIYGRKVPKAPSERFIIAIALTDFAMNLCFILFTGKLRWWRPDGDALQFCLLSNSFYDVINTSSSILVCWMTVNRWVAVCRPHSYNTIFTTKRVNYMLLSTIALSLPSCALSFSICLSHFPPKGWNIVPSDATHFDVVKFIWVNIRLLLLIVAAVLMAVLYRLVAVTMNEKKAKASQKALQMTTCVENTRAPVKTQCENGAAAEPNVPIRVGTKVRLDAVPKSRFVIEGDEADKIANVEVTQANGEDKIQLSVQHSADAIHDIKEAHDHIGQADEAEEADGKQGIGSKMCRRLTIPTPHAERRRSSFTQLVAGRSSLRGQRKRKTSSRASLLDQNLTMTLFAISVAYVVLMIPDVIIQFLDSLNFFEDSLFENYRTPAQLLYTINFVTNPVIYFICNNYFKTELKKLVARCCPVCVDFSGATSSNC
ncbi:uncharacterized protein LOC134845295 isoform X2 [Symsagittifera roscoffensis]|uniref:uncharacterized protein LOC134845295 isoform X2 n=1 Tax=Symsagittifera roscoffensis TaxID=84072 RepID=UPI00307B6793